MLLLTSDRIRVIRRSQSGIDIVIKHYRLLYRNGLIS